MYFRGTCFFATVLLSIWVVHCDKVSVTVYYESLCPDSKRFFTSQLYPTLQTNLSKWVNLTLVPYGKSNQTNLGDDQWKFTCHHGPFECQGNKIQACALHEIELSTPTPANAGFNPIAAGFINCLMDKTVKQLDPVNRTPTYDFPIRNCSEINHVQQFAQIENCAGHSDGGKLLAKLGDMTVQFQNPLKSVPTIVFNEKYNEEDSKLASTNFVKVLCQHIKDDQLPECKSASSTMTLSILVFALAFFKQLL